jgi:cytochrome P450
MRLCMSFRKFSSTGNLTTYVILIVAGSETSATLLCGCIFYLCTNPRAMSHVVGEIRSAFHSAEETTFRSSAALPYLDAVIEESLRMYPPFVTSLARITPADGATVYGHFVPDGVRLHFIKCRITVQLTLSLHCRQLSPLCLLPLHL